MDFAEIKSLVKALDSARAKGATTYNFSRADGTSESLSVDAMEGTLRKELFELCGTRSGFEAHKYELFALIASEIDTPMAREIGNVFGDICEVGTFAANEAPVFKYKKDPRHLRARRFAVLGSSAGSYEVFKLDGESSIQVKMSAITDACQIALNDFLTGRVDWNEMLEAFRQGMEDRIIDAVNGCMAAAEKNLPAANKASTTNFDPSAFEKILAVVSAYGTPVVSCTEAFARTITEGYQWASEAEKLARRNVGYVANYKGAKIAIMPQTFKDADNSVKAVDDSKAYIFPMGAGPMIHIALQGDTQLRDVQNEDWSTEIQGFRRFGVAATIFNQMGTYEITSLK